MPFVSKRQIRHWIENAECDKCDEFQKEVAKLNKQIYKLKRENTKLKKEQKDK